MDPLEASALRLLEMQELCVLSTVVLSGVIVNVCIARVLCLNKRFTARWPLVFLYLIFVLL